MIKMVLLTLMFSGMQSFQQEEVLSQIEEPRGIAIDLSRADFSIWLADHFSHVVAVPMGHQFSTVEERENLTLCNKKIVGKVFDPQREVMLKQFLYDDVYQNEQIKNKNISLIHCDIEGDEENLLEDLLHFCYYNKVKLHISFYCPWWKNSKIKDFDYLFKYFNASVPNIGEYITKNPFGSLLLTPRSDAGILVKKNMTTLVICYNQITYLKNMIRQLERYTSDIVVIDNKGTFASLLNYYDRDFQYAIFRQKRNCGCAGFLYDEYIQKLVGDVYVVTDPDLQFNPNLPNDFLEILFNLSIYFEAYKVGFALNIWGDDLRKFEKIDYVNAEKGFWEKKLVCLPHLDLEIYEAGLDTTFCLMNKKFAERAQLRVAGDFTCRHIPWHTDYRTGFLEGEYEAYLKDNISTNYFGE